MDAKKAEQLSAWLHEERRQAGPSRNDAMLQRMAALWRRIVTLQESVIALAKDEDEWAERKILHRLARIENDDPPSSEDEGGAPVPVEPFPPVRPGWIAQPLDGGEDGQRNP